LREKKNPAQGKNSAQEIGDTMRERQFSSNGFWVLDYV
jgi:hypothetical protein